MTQILTPKYIRSLQSNIHINAGIKVPYGDQKKANSTDWNDHYFQLLIFEKDSNGHFTEPKLMYGTQQELVQEYKIDSSYLPTVGAKVNPAFLDGTSKSDETESYLRDSFLSTVRFLLQCRLLSQNISSTWLDEKQDIRKLKCEQIELSQKILDHYNVAPKSYRLKSQNPLNSKELEEYLRGIDQESSENSKGINFLKPKKSFLILPTSISYNSISLSLLLCGQAYYECGKDDEGNKQWKRIWEPIFSTYEMVWEYAIDLSWDSFYATRIDIPQAGEHPKPPYTKVTLGYPPKPDEYSLKQEEIKEWCQAEEDYQDSKYPFYPEVDSGEWENMELEFVAPPYPYIPLSTI